MRRRSSPKGSQVQLGNEGVGRRAGFTFLELLVVVIIVGVISASVLPVFSSSFASLRVRNAKADLMAAIAHAQECAVRESTPYRFNLDPESRSYWITRYKSGVGEEEVFERVPDKWGQETALPDALEVSRPKMRKDRETKAFYLQCYPNGACDMASISVTTKGRGRASKFTFETLGALGQFEVKDGYSEVKGD